MAVRSTVRETQRRIATLDAGHRRAVAQMERAEARRAEAMTEQDQLVTTARAGVDLAVVEMATAVGPELTATLLGLDPAEVRRLTKAAPAGPPSRRPVIPATTPRLEPAAGQ
jgi:hypothetical protein